MLLNTNLLKAVFKFTLDEIETKKTMIDENRAVCVSLHLTQTLLIACNLINKYYLMIKLIKRNKNYSNYLFTLIAKL